MTQEEVLQIVIATLEKNNIPYMLTGAIAANCLAVRAMAHSLDNSPSYSLACLEPPKEANNSANM